MRELKRFFEDYKALENKKVLVSEPQGRSEALQVLRDAISCTTRRRSAHRRPSCPPPRRSRPAQAPRSALLQRSGPRARARLAKARRR